MASSAYRQGQRTALTKLGVLGTALGGAALGGLAGYALSPEDRKGYGTLYGAGLGGLGAGLGSKVAPYLHDISSEKDLLARLAMPVVGTGLGTAAGIGLSQAAINKNTPSTTEDPYRYHAG